MSDEIGRFAGAYRFLSGFYPAQVDWEGIIYTSSEHAFNAGKTLEQELRERIAAAPTPAEAKRLGGPPSRGGIVRELRPGWDELVRYHVMGQVQAIKFADPVLFRQLLATGSAQLVEGNTWHDTHWGVCHCPRHGGVGDNHLGRMLMRVRAQLAAHR